MAVMAVLSINTTPQATWSVILLGTLGLGGIAEVGALTGRKRYRMGWAWAFLFLVCTAGWKLGWLDIGKSLYSWPPILYAHSQLLVTISLFSAFVATVTLEKGTYSQRLARGGYLWLSFVLITSLMVLLWLSLLLVCRISPGYEAWLYEFAKGMPYDVRLAEIAMMAAEAFTFVIVPLFGVAIYFSKELRENLGFPNESGEAAHSMLAVFLASGPFFLLTAAALTVIFGLGHHPEANRGMLSIYAISALRIPALLTFLLPGVRVVSDILGDVLFHIQPDGSEVSSRVATTERLRSLLDTLNSNSIAVDTIVIAHSQGTVIAWTLLKEEPRLARALVTVGCPLQTLYRRFLGEKYQEGFHLPIPWFNFYHDGDYIGGKIDGIFSTSAITGGTHTNYWPDSHVISDIEQEIGGILQAHNPPV